MTDKTTSAIFSNDNSTSSSEASELLSFWFGELTNQLPSEEKRRLWYRATEADDLLLKDKYLSLYQQARLGKLDSWHNQQASSLALIILLDQIPRNIFRGQAQAFATDDLALEVSKQGIAQGFDRDLPLIYRIFYYHPFEHSECLTEQSQSVAYYQGLYDQYSAEQHRVYLTNTLNMAIKHRDIIEQYQRFPHRNAILGRESVEAEREYLASGTNFGQVKR